ncbi:MAG: DUF362 domain-containing protein [Candidatus Aerophobetes bacterium]|nr:DUF362 domain-containing protein [Candidatus Aerophobetes bacterium]
MSTVSIIKCKSYDEEKVYQSIDKSIRLIGGIDDIIKPEDKVLLKINLLSARPPEEAVTTHPAVIGAVIRLIRERGAVPWVGDAAPLVSGFTRREKDAFDICGIRKTVEKEGGKIVNFSRTGYSKIKIKEAEQLKEINIAKPILQADAIISLPKLKTHELTLLTGAVKNFFGCVPSSDRSKAHRLANEGKFAQAVVDIYSVCKPCLAVMDGISAMEGEGPSAGDPISLGLILASRDCVSLDVVASQITGFKPSEILTSVDAIQRGLGPENLQKIKVVGEEIKNVSRLNFKKPVAYKNFSFRILRRLLTPLGTKILASYPHLRKERCNKCGICAQKCPVGAIQLNPYPGVNYTRCIQCYVCHEFCPQEAISIKTGWLGQQWEKLTSRS